MGRQWDAGAMHGVRRAGDILMLTPASNIAILGFGARATCFAALLAPRGCALRAWDPGLSNGDATMRARIEASGVDAIDELATALRGARLVLLDTVPLTATLQAHLQPGQRVLALDTAPAADVDVVLIALGLPPQAANWRAALHDAALRAVANSAAATPDTPAVRRGELP
ncbi:MAG: hypothetical protein WDO12_07570 [Pseudomonadota bacterium]